MMNWQTLWMTAMAAALMLTAPLLAEVQTEKVVYKDGDTELHGHIYFDDSVEGKRPGVLVIHEWWGLNKYARMRARLLAQMGYTAFAVDMYGEGKNTTERHTAQQWAMMHFKNLDMMRRRAQLGLKQLKAHPTVDKTNTAAIGYCFGGTSVLQLAFSGADVKGVVSFHGNTLPPGEGDAAKVKCKILVCHGARDPYVPNDRVAAFMDGLIAGDVDVQLIAYSDAVHSFTNPGAGDDRSKGSAYNKLADQRSWAQMQVFFSEIFESN